MDVTKLTLCFPNWSSPDLHGPGKKYTIMARPRAWEHGDGKCHQLTPSIALFDAVKSGRISLETYRARYIATLWDKAQDGAFEPGNLVAHFGTEPIIIADGDSLLCACSKVAASRGECHRVWAAQILAENGWNVILDGKELKP